MQGAVHAGLASLSCPPALSSPRSLHPPACSPHQVSFSYGKKGLIQASCSLAPATCCPLPPRQRLSPLPIPQCRSLEGDLVSPVCFPWGPARPTVLFSP